LPLGFYALGQRRGFNELSAADKAEIKTLNVDLTRLGDEMGPERVNRLFQNLMPPAVRDFGVHELTIVDELGEEWVVRRLDG